MSTLEQITETQRSLENTLMQRMAEFESQLQGSSASPSSTDNVVLRKEFQAFKELVRNIFDLLRQQISELCKSVDIMETRHRRKFLVINGIPESADSDAKTQLIEIIHSRLQLKTLDSSDIVSCHRLGDSPVEGRTRPILAKFADTNIKAQIWRKKTLLRGSSVVFSEFLTRSRQTLFLAARKHFGMRNVWTTDGIISIKLPDNTRRRIIGASELDALIAAYPGDQAGSQMKPGTSAAGKAATPVISKTQAGTKLKTTDPSKIKRSTRR
ncbi:hypothetical protein ABMA28_005521 [Loxostege sticticalis]|uniref:Uncharacterized protein n=1 Tax=Loxostege sticticalis TaxID=481309 RepID=A0ABD0SLX3_LOXSC